MMMGSSKAVEVSIRIGVGAARIVGCWCIDILAPNLNPGPYAHGEKQADNQHH